MPPSKDYYESRPGVIYLIQAGKRGPLKVGWCISVDSRRDALQAGNHQKLHVLATIPGTGRNEAEIHGWLHVHEMGIRGDWFKAKALPLLVREFGLDVVHVRAPQSFARARLPVGEGLHASFDAERGAETPHSHNAGGGV